MVLLLGGEREMDLDGLRLILGEGYPLLEGGVTVRLLLYLGGERDGEREARRRLRAGGLRLSLLFLSLSRGVSEGERGLRRLGGGERESEGDGRRGGVDLSLSRERRRGGDRYRLSFERDLRRGGERDENRRGGPCKRSKGTLNAYKSYPTTASTVLKAASAPSSPSAAAATSIVVVSNFIETCPAISFVEYAGVSLPSPS